MSAPAAQDELRTLQDIAKHLKLKIPQNMEEAEAMLDAMNSGLNLSIEEHNAKIDAEKSGAAASSRKKTSTE